MASFATTPDGARSVWALLERAYAHMWARHEELFYPLPLHPEQLSVAQREELGLHAALPAPGAPSAPVAYILLSPTLEGHAAWGGTLAALFKDVRITAQAVLDIDYAGRPRVTPLPASMLPDGTTPEPASELRAVLCPGRLLARVTIVDGSRTAGVISATIVGVFRAGLAGAPLSFPAPAPGPLRAA